MQQLLWGLIEDDITSVNAALERGADVNLRSPSGSTVLHVTALRGAASLMNLLLRYDVTIDVVDHDGFTPLMVAALNGQEKAVKELLKRE